MNVFGQLSLDVPRVSAPLYSVSPTLASPKGGKCPQAEAASAELLRAKEHLGRKGTSKKFFSFAENIINAHLKIFHVGTSLGVHWLRFHLPVQRV